MSDATLVRNDLAVPANLACDTPSGLVPDAPSSRVCRFIIYDLYERASGRHYVGLTARTLGRRLAAHLSQARRGLPIRDGGLMAALRAMLEDGLSFETAWTGRVVARTDDIDEARALERHWIVTLSARAPEGFNLMPGGGVGGPSSAMSLTIRMPDGVPRSYASIQEAIEDLNRNALSNGRSAVGPSTIYARLALGWSPEAALGYEPHEDGRGQRAQFELDERSYTTLREAAEQTGIPVSTLRSRLHRLTQVVADQREIGADRRSCRTRGSRLQIPWPKTGELLTAAEFAARTGLPKATVIHRWHQAGKRMAVEGRKAPATLFRWLTKAVERRKMLTLTLPDGTVWNGGERELIRRLLADSRLEDSRSEHLSESGIRSRLRGLATGERKCPGRVAWAFGFSAKRGS